MTDDDVSRPGGGPLPADDRGSPPADDRAGAGADGASRAQARTAKATLRRSLRGIPGVCGIGIARAESGRGFTVVVNVTDHDLLDHIPDLVAETPVTVHEVSRPRLLDRFR